MKANKLNKLKNSLKYVCLWYSDFKSDKRRISFGEKMFERLNSNINYDALYDNQIVYKGAQWGSKWGNFYHAIYYRDGEFHYGTGFSSKQILNS